MSSRAFILGNGLSLKDFDYDRLQGEVTFATGRINLIYGRFSWRPTYYVKMDRFSNKNWIAEVKLHLEEGYPTWIGADLLLSMRPWWADYDVTGVPRCHSDIETFPSDNWHPPRYCTFGGSIPVALQVAMFEYRYNPIYVLGCDGYVAGQQTHMVEGYLREQFYDKAKVFRANMTLDHAHGYANAYAKRNGIKIFNCNPDTIVARPYSLADLDKVLST